MYKVILFNHGQTAANGRVLLDTSSGENPGLTQAVVETKLNEAGSFNYSIIPTHPLYNMTSPLKVYVSVEEDGTEIFYGRILSVQTNPLTKIKSVTCEGALAFLLDAELPKDSTDRTSSASDYFKYCINTYNSEIKNDANRVLKIGTINAEGVSEQHTYNNGSYAQIQGMMKSQLLGVHDGFFRIRRQNSTGDHYIDWVKQVGTTNPQQIAITHNVISQNNTESGEDIFSMMRPIGNDGITLGEGDNGLLTVSSSMRNDYGTIIRTVTFDAKDTSTLRSKATDYIEKIRNRLTITGDISFVDFHFLDGSSTKVHVGDVFTHIEGYEGTKLTAESVSRNLLDAGKDKLTIKNDKDLMNSATASGANSSNTTGVKSGGKVSSGAAHMYKFYHETQTDASIAAKNIYISAEEKIEVRAKQVETYADEIDEKLSEEIGKVKVNTDSLQTEWTTYKGTEIYKNKDHIDQVCGLYQVQEYTDPTTGETVKNLVVQEGSAIYQTHNGVIMGVYDNYNLTGGMMVQKINGQTETLIKGDLVNIGDTGTTVKLSDKITVVDGGTLIKGLVMFKASDSATNSVSINNGKVTAETVQPTTLTFHGTGGESDYVNLGYATVANMLTNAEVDTANNTLKIWKIGDAANAPSITFRKATTLSGTWSGSLPAKTLTVKTDDPQGPTYLVQFEGTYSANRTNLEVHSGGSITIETDSMGAKRLSIPIKVQRLTGAQSEPETVYETTLNPIYMNLLTSLEATKNQRYNLAEDLDHIGYLYVDVNVVPVLSGTWDGNTLSVTSNPRGNTYQVQVGGTPSYSTSRTNLEVVSNGAATVSKIGSTKYVDVPVKVQRLTGAQTAPVSVYETTLNPIYTNLLTPLEATTNGSYNLANDDNHIGYSSVQVNVPDKAVNTRFGAGNGNYWIEGFYPNESGAPTVSGSTTAYQLATTGSNASAVVQIKDTSSRPSKLANTAELSVGYLYNNGFNAVGSPTLTLPSVLEINEGRAETIPITASVANKTTGAARTITQNFSLERNTYTNSNNVKNVVCVNLIDKADANNVYGRISVATYWNQGARTAWLWRLNSSNKWVKLTGSETISGGQTLRVRYTSAAHEDTNVPDAIFYTPNDSGGGGGGDSYSHDMYIKCTNKAQTYPGSTVYNYTFVCEGAKDGLTTVGSSLHVHW